MMSFLIVLHLIGGEDWVSFLRVILKFTSGSAFEIGWISSKFIMSCYLIQSILITEGFILTIIDWIFLFLEGFLLLSSKVLTPTS